MSSSSRRPKSPTRVQLSSRLAYENKIPKFLQRLKNQVEGKIDVSSSYDDDDEEYRKPAYSDADYGRGTGGDEYGRDAGWDEYNGRDEFGRERRAPDHGGYNDDEFEYMNDGSGRPPIPRRPRSSSPKRREQRPPIPTRPDDDPGSADEDSDDEKPQVVVLKAGKHLSEREAENERRKERGLPPLPEPDKTDPTISSNNKSQSAKNKESKSLSFSSKSSSSTSKSSNNFNALKRKVLGGGVHDDEEDNDEGRGREVSRIADGTTKKRKKKNGLTPKDSSKKKEKRTLLSFGDDA
ncbi:hypothetical protein GGU10DRAFT_386028 [Lentinula aff. detonsa]|uniref:DUF4604 domain-containing protein n=1 Tax=Lentinula aff. detonsa TaxID=2804958 RepID=A0AA38L6D3_9AGAR|nr:hypothetical protein GGU10DRAFT_386028 [Lentinula aff. detonsa]